MGEAGADPGLCTQIAAMMSAYIDGEVGAEEYQFIAVHISQCPPCGEEEHAQRRIQALVVRAVRRPSAPVELQTRIRTILRSLGSLGSQ